MPGCGKRSPMASRRHGTRGWGAGGGKAKRERRDIGACSAGPGAGRGGLDTAGDAQPGLVLRRRPGPPGGQAGWADCCARGRGLKQPALNQMWASGQRRLPALRPQGSWGDGRPYPGTCRARGAPARDGLGSRRPASWAPSSRGNGGTRGSSAPRAGPSAERGLGARVDAGWAADKKRQLPESQGATDRETRSPGGRRHWAASTEAVPAPRRKPSQRSQGTGLDWGGQPEATLGQG